MSIRGMEVTDTDRLIARKNKFSVTIVSILFPPIGYLMVKQYGLAVLCLITFGFFFLGILIVPLHTRQMINRARRRVDDAED